MARKFIVVDDLTDAEIDGVSHEVRVTIAVLPSDAAKDYKPVPVEATWEISPYTSEALVNFVANSDLADFIIRLRPLVKLTTVDSDVVRKWAKAAHPEIQVGDKGRIPADVLALYRREVVAKTEAGDK